MLAYIDWHASPIIFEIFGFPLRWYGLMFGLAFLSGYQILSYIFKQEGRPIKQADELLLYAIISTIVGARMAHYFFYEYPLLLADPGKFFLDMITPPFSGLASHGTMLMFFAIYLFSKKRNVSYLYVTDRIVPTIAFGGALIRFGNLMNSEIIGKPTDLPWGFKFFNDAEHINNIVPRHPSQLYESITCILLFILIMWIWSIKKEKTPNGLLTGVFLIILFTLRFFYEFLKENQVSFEDSMTLNMGQWLSIPCVIFGIIILYFTLKKNNSEVVI
jgi:phosphatidylglycerol---prolipoprotein diacylglyceryl transferase